MTAFDESELSARLARNLRHLREAPRPDPEAAGRAGRHPPRHLGHLESGMGNPTLAVLHRVAAALQVSLEELISRQHAACVLYPKGSLPSRHPGHADVKKLLPDPIRAWRSSASSCGRGV